MLGVELGGSLKNVLAIAAGIADGLGFGDRNGKGDIFGMGTSWNNHVKVFKVKLIKYQ